MKQPDRTATARTPEQRLQRALKAGTGKTENVCVCVCECAYVQETARKVLPPPHSSPLQNPYSILSGTFSTVRKESLCLFPSIV